MRRESSMSEEEIRPASVDSPQRGQIALKVASRQKGYKLAYVQAKQIEDGVKDYYLTDRVPPKLDSGADSTKRGEDEDEDEDSSSFLPPSDSHGDEIQRNLGILEVSSHPDSGHQYNHLIELLGQQEQKCRRYCQQFRHMGNITETTKFERLAEECVSQIEALKVALAKGYQLPKFQTEDRVFNAYKIIPELSGRDMLLTIVRGINLPRPEELSSSDLETSVRFEFPFPSLKEAQRDQTRSFKNCASPEFGEQFTLHIKPSHRGFKRALSKGIKFEIIQKGGLFKTDKVVGSALLKLDCLESDCESRQLIEVLKRQTPTSGYLEVVVKVREPFKGPQCHTVTEKWLVLDSLSLPPVDAHAAQIRDSRIKKVSHRSTACSVL